MKFDAARAETVFRELCDPRYAGPDGERRVAELIAARFEANGLVVERRKVAGSRFPRWLSGWFGWPGFGVFAATVYGLLLQNDPRLTLAGLVLSLFCAPWVNRVMTKPYRPGWGGVPAETVPLVAATLPERPATHSRVVLQAAISGADGDAFPLPVSGFVKRTVAYLILLLFPTLWALTRIHDPGSRLAGIMSMIATRFLYPAFLATLWFGILRDISRRCVRWRAAAGKIPPDRRALAILVEMARAWPHVRSRSLEPVFVVVGGQRLDYAGYCEVVSWPGEPGTSRPCLLVYLFAPGAGEEIGLCVSAPSAPGLSVLAESAARSLWIPHRNVDSYALFSLRPFETVAPVIALIGSDPRRYDDASVDPLGLQRAAQLATEIVLRWAKAQEDGEGFESNG